MANAFISFIHEEEAVALGFQALLQNKVGDQHRVFVTADNWQMRGGEGWLDRIRTELHRAAVVVTLLSPRSIERPWVNFEAGAAWFAGRPIIPVCYAGLDRGQLRRPYSDFQAYNLREDHYHVVRSVNHWLTNGGMNPLPYRADDPFLMRLLAELNAFD